MKKIFFAVIICLIINGVNAQLKVGTKAPEISLPNTKDSMVNLSSLNGKVVLIDFWASWCGPCRASIPSVIKIYNKYKDVGFEVFGVSIDNKKTAWLKAIKKDKIKYTQVNDAAGWYSKIAEKYGVDAIPATFLLNKNGVIEAVDIDGKDLEKKIKSLL